MRNNDVSKDKIDNVSRILDDVLNAKVSKVLTEVSRI